jgi:hypothetical protein
MAKLFAVTDKEGNVLGTLRADAVQTEEGDTIQVAPDLVSPEISDKYQYVEVEVSEELLRAAPEDLHKEVALKIESENS